MGSYGDLGGELIRELSRSKNDCPAYDDTAVREIVEQSINLTNKNREALNSPAWENLTNNELDAVDPEDRSIYTNVCIRTAAIERNKRCLLAYHSKRLDKIRELRWEIGPVVPEVYLIFYIFDFIFCIQYTNLPFVETHFREKSWFPQMGMGFHYRVLLLTI